MTGQRLRVLLVSGSLPPMRCGVGDYVAGLARVKKDWMPDKDNLLTLGICSRNLGALAIGGAAATV